MAASWYDSDWSTRIPILVNTSGSSGTADVSITVPVTMSQFWDLVQSDGDDVRVTTADGYTPVTYQLGTWSYATREAVIELDNVTVPVANELMLLWLYVGNDSAVSAAGSFTPSGAVQGYITPEHPTPKLVLGSERPGSTTPAVNISKTTEDVLLLYVRLDVLLSDRCGPDYEGGRGYEGVRNLTYEVSNGGTPDGGMIAMAEVRVVDCATNGAELWMRVLIAGGTTATNYLVTVDCETTAGRRVRRGFQVSVNDLSES